MHFKTFPATNCQKVIERHDVLLYVIIVLALSHQLWLVLHRHSRILHVSRWAMGDVYLHFYLCFVISATPAQVSASTSRSADAAERSEQKTVIVTSRFSISSFWPVITSNIWNILAVSKMTHWVTLTFRLVFCWAKRLSKNLNLNAKLWI